MQLPTGSKQRIRALEIRFVPDIPPSASIELPGQAAIVTGGTRGLGRVIGETLARAGCAVTVCGRAAPEDLPPGVAFESADVRDPEQARALVDAVAARHGRIDILVNNAGGSPPSEAASASPR